MMPILICVFVAFCCQMYNDNNIVILWLIILMAIKQVLLYKHTSTPSPPTKSLDFRGFDSSRLLSLKGGNSRVRGIL